jgi:Uma2 family endonuclease
MREYLDNGTRLAWLIDPLERKVHVYRPGVEVEILSNPSAVSGDPELAGFRLDLTGVWDPGI